MSHDPGPAADPWSAYRAGLAEGRLLYQRCTACKKAQFYPRVLCAHCGEYAPEWQESAGAGVVYATSAIHERGAEPRNVVLVDLDEGFRMMSRVVGVPADSVAIGAPVRARVVEEAGEPVVVFEGSGSA
ncbi:Zn-ribbon domain-containing OB-fold protein [Streptomyces sp. NPDC056817]|uniref:Zn-ribbon domain-containing OB-fold protein n=1 Tax=Streptomyces sp. NPDC056817 TaxID=3345950 RepID=UPI00368070E5